MSGEICVITGCDEALAGGRKGFEAIYRFEDINTVVVGPEITDAVLDMFMSEDDEELEKIWEAEEAACLATLSPAERAEVEAENALLTKSENMDTRREFVEAVRAATITGCLVEDMSRPTTFTFR